jgi:DNA-binding transcriptional regulator YhcF (GntR family)
MTTGALVHRALPLMKEMRVDRSAEQPDPPSVRIIAEIRRRIGSGELRAGDRVPSTRQITQEWGVAMATATKVLTALRQEGLVRAVPGAGTVVATPEPRRTPSPRPTRRRKTREPTHELTRERIVRTAIEIADTEGLAVLSMRRIATELDVATMSLYRHVPSKEELVLLMTDAALSEDTFPEPPPPGWRARLELSSRMQWAIYHRHPWLAQAISLTRPQLLPNALAHAEWVLRAVDGLGLDPSTMLYVHVTLFNYVRGIAVNFEPEAEAEQETGITNEQWMDSQNSAFAEVLASGRFPTFARVVAHPGVEFDLDTLFEFGLRRMLDGLAVLLESSRT